MATEAVLIAAEQGFDPIKTLHALRLKHHELYEKINLLSSELANEIQKQNLKRKKSDDKITIQIKRLTGPIITLEGIAKNEPIFKIKELFYKKTGIPPDQVRLIFNGKELLNALTLSGYGIEDQTMIHSVLKLRGGMYCLTSGRYDLGSLTNAERAELRDLENKIYLLRNQVNTLSSLLQTLQKDSGLDSD